MVINTGGKVASGSGQRHKCLRAGARNVRAPPWCGIPLSSTMVWNTIPCLLSALVSKGQRRKQPHPPYFPLTTHSMLSSLSISTRSTYTIPHRCKAHANTIAQGPQVGTTILYLFYEPSMPLCFHEQDIKLKFCGLAFPRVQFKSGFWAKKTGNY